MAEWRSGRSGTDIIGSGTGLYKMVWINVPNILPLKMDLLSNKICSRGFHPGNGEAHQKQHSHFCCSIAAGVSKARTSHL